MQNIRRLPLPAPLATQTNSATLKYRHIITQWSKVERTCASCGAKYFEIDNLGQWRCAQSITIASRGANDDLVSNSVSVPADHRSLADPTVWTLANVQIFDPRMDALLLPFLDAKSSYIVDSPTARARQRHVLRYDRVSEQTFITDMRKPCDDYAHTRLTVCRQHFMKTGLRRVFEMTGKSAMAPHKIFLGSRTPSKMERRACRLGGRI